MYFYKHLYVSGRIRNPEQAKRKLRRNAGQLLLYVVTLCGEEEGNQLAIMHSAFLQQPYYKKNPPLILGLASGRWDAVELVRQIVQETYDHTGGADVRAYLFPHGVRIRRGSWKAAGA